MSNNKLKVNYFVIFLLLILLVLIYKPLIILFVPGFLLLFNKEILRKSLIRIIAYIISLSLSFWTITPWFIKFIGIGLIEFIYIILIISLLIILFFFLFNKKLSKILISFNRSSLIILLIFVFVIFLRFVPYFMLIAPPSPGDVTMHATISRLIVENNNWPSTYEPLMPIKRFGDYAPGAQTLAAEISLVSGMGVHRSTFFIACLTYGLITLALYVFLRNFFNKSVALITSLIASFTTTYPQLLFHWGGNPTALSFFYIIVGLALIKDINKKYSFTKLLIVSGVFCSSALTHMSIFLPFCYVYLFVVIYKIIRSYKNKLYLNIANNLIRIVMISLIFLIPYIIKLFSGLSSVNTNVLKESVFDHTVSLMPGKSLLNYILVGPIQAVGYCSFILVLLAFIGLIISVINKKYNLIGICFVYMFAIILLLINSYSHALPFSYIIFIDRLSMFFILPLSLLVGLFIHLLYRNYKMFLFLLFVIYIIICIFYLSSFKQLDFEHSPYNTDRTSIDFNSAITLIMFQTLQGPTALYLFGMSPDSILTNSDLEAFNWIKENTFGEDLFLNNPSDGGKWVSALAYRPMLMPHVSVAYHKDMDLAYHLSEFSIPETDISTIAKSVFNYTALKDYEFLKDRKVKYIYIGKKSFWKQEFLPDDFDNEKFLKVYNNNGVIIYKIIY